MVEQTPWLKRDFSFGLDVGLYPCFLARLAAGPARADDHHFAAARGVARKLAGG